MQCLQYQITFQARTRLNIPICKQVYPNTRIFYMHVLSEFPQFGMPSSLMNFIYDMSFNVSKFKSSTLKDITHINEFHTRVKKWIRNSQIGRRFCAPQPLMGAIVFHNEVNYYVFLSCSQISISLEEKSYYITVFRITVETSFIPY